MALTTQLKLAFIGTSILMLAFMGAFFWCISHGWKWGAFFILPLWPLLFLLVLIAIAGDRHERGL